jgi:uncharacterized protein YneF (UPF0154 family)
MSVEMANHMAMIQVAVSLIGPPAIFAIVLGGFWLARRGIERLRA